MKHRRFIAVAAALLLSAGSVMAATVYVSGSGQSHDAGVALESARADAVAKCTAQQGIPIQEVHNNLTRAALWIASSVWSCDVP